jgi:hypothetical protein
MGRKDERMLDELTQTIAEPIAVALAEKITELQQQPSLRIYTAMAFGGYERVRKFNQDLREVGHVVTHDWTLGDQYGEDGHPIITRECEHEQEIAVLRQAAINDTRGVRKADLVVFLADDPTAQGALAEFGMAIAFGVPAWVVAPWRMTAFFHMPGVEVIATEGEVRARLGCLVEA